MYMIMEFNNNGQPLFYNGYEFGDFESGTKYFMEKENAGNLIKNINGVDNVYLESIDIYTVLVV